MRGALALWLLGLVAGLAGAEVTVNQLTEGPQHHFYGYIGQAGNTPWSGDNRYLVLLRTSFQDHMPAPDEPAEVVLVDTASGNAMEKMDETRAWNFQQGTMLYWHPKARDTQFFFNDRDPATNKLFTVLYDVPSRSRVREFRFEDTPVANSGVLPDGEHFLALNYGRLARLRPVTGYPEAFDWTNGAGNPEGDGVWMVSVESGEKSLLVSYAALAAQLKQGGTEAGPLFINHTLGSRDGNWMYAYARAGWHGENRPKRIDAPFLIALKGGSLTIPLPYAGGHPEWSRDQLIVGAKDGQQILFDPVAQKVARSVGTREQFPEPGGDVAISFDGEWLVNGWHDGRQSCYRVFNLATSETFTTPCVQIGDYREGDLRIDPAPCWNRDGSAIAVPGLAADGTRQTFILHLK